MVVKTIEATRTRTGLRVQAALDTGDYSTGIAISKERFQTLPLQRHATHGTWNYTLRPQPIPGSTEAVPAGEQGAPAGRRQASCSGATARPRQRCWPTRPARMCSCRSAAKT